MTAKRRSLPPPNITVVASDGTRFPAHSAILASASPVLETMVRDAHRGWSDVRAIRIPGVPSDAVFAFIRLLYPSDHDAGAGASEMERHGVHLLALAHAYGVRWLKISAEAAVSGRLTAEDAADMLKLAKMCDARRLFFRCVRLAAADFPAVANSDGWRFLCRHDPALELELLQAVEDAEERKKRWRKEKEAQELYAKLALAMDCLEHIFHRGAAGVAVSPCKDRGAPCQGLRPLMRHFAACGKKLGLGSCTRCRRTWQLFRLHAAMCGRPAGACRVPLCGRWKRKAEDGDRTWRILVRKVAVARAMSSFAERSSTEMPAAVKMSHARHRRPR